MEEAPADSAAACLAAGCPNADQVGAATALGNVEELRVIERALRGGKRNGPAPRLHYDLVAEILRRCALCVRLKASLFDENGVAMLNKPGSMRAEMLTTLGLLKDGDPAPRTGSITDYLTSTGPPEGTSKGTTKKDPLTLEQAARRMPFVDILGTSSKSTVLSVKVGLFTVTPHALLSSPGKRVLLCFLCRDSHDTPLRDRPLSWPPNGATVALNGKFVNKDGDFALPVDVTDRVLAYGDSPSTLCVSVPDATSGTDLLFMDAVFFTCEDDTKCREGDATDYMARHPIPEIEIPVSSASAGDGSNSDDDDLVVIGDVCVPLTCPYTMGRMTVPVRTATCTHPQSFDLGSHFIANANLKNARWACPLCSHPATTDLLRFDTVLHHALKSEYVQENYDIERVSLSDDRRAWRDVDGMMPWQDPTQKIQVVMEESTGTTQTPSEVRKMDFLEEDQTHFEYGMRDVDPATELWEEQACDSCGGAFLVQRDERGSNDGTGDCMTCQVFADEKVKILSPYAPKL